MRCAGGIRAFAGGITAYLQVQFIYTMKSYCYKRESLQLLQNIRLIAKAYRGRLKLALRYKEAANPKRVAASLR